MKKTINISLGGRAFNLEEDAYEKLDRYISSVKQHFGDNPDKDEIISDIEHRIAEQFELLNKQDQIITVKEVSELIKIMGTVDQIDGSENAHQSHSDEHSYRKLYRDMDNGILGGVATGIAAYFDIDPWLIRLAFAASVLIGGGGVIAYLILWIVIPEARTTTERLRMRGSAVNLESITKNARETRDKLKEVGEKGAGAAGHVVRGIFKVIQKLVGLFIVVAAAGLLAFLTVSLVVGLLQKDSASFGFPLARVAPPQTYVLILVVSYLAIFIPLLFVLMFGASALRSKSVFNSKAGFSLLGLWFIALIAGGVMAVRYGPEYVDQIRNLPEYKTVDKTYDLKDFSKLDLSGATAVNYTQSKDFSVVAHGTQTALDRYSLSVEQGTLKNSFTNVKEAFCFFCGGFRTSALTIDITAPTLDEVDLSGASRAQLDKIPNDLKLKTSGASEIEIAQLNGSLATDESGASRVTILKGQGTKLVAKLSGASYLEADSYDVKDAVISESGASHGYVNVESTLDVDLSGVSKVYYLGQPQITSKLSGASKVLQEPVQQDSYESDTMPFAPQAPAPANIN